MHAGERARQKRDRGPSTDAEKVRLVIALALLPIAVLGVWCFLSVLHGDGGWGPGQ